MYEPSETADMLVDGDLAVVLLTWIDTFVAADGTMIEQARGGGPDTFGVRMTVAGGSVISNLPLD
jgi:hypothetical protein